MIKTVAIIASCDTKYKEACYMRSCLQKAGLNTLLLDMSIGLGLPQGADITRETIFSDAGYAWDDIKSRTKGELMELMTVSMDKMVQSLYQQKCIHGVMSAGGVQNTSVASNAMQHLPIGFPKVIATTIACGQKPFGSVVGLRDIVVIPSISDFTGLNMITQTILQNACGCMAGMISHADAQLQKSRRPVVGVSLMGITNEGCCAAIDELDRLGIEAVGFHSTGVGGSIMEQLACSGDLDGILDMTTHEIASEFFGGGFSYGAKNRLIAPLEQSIPMVVSVGGLDFVDYDKDHLPARMNERVYNMHNAYLAHIKLLPDEARELGKLFAQRMNCAKLPVHLVLPTEGMRKNTRIGGNLYCKETDDALLGAIKENLGCHILVDELAGNLNDLEWGQRIAHIMAAELKSRGIYFHGEEQL